MSYSPLPHCATTRLAAIGARQVVGKRSWPALAHIPEVIVRP